MGYGSLPLLEAHSSPVSRTRPGNNINHHSLTHSLHCTKMGPTYCPSRRTNKLDPTFGSHTTSLELSTASSEPPLLVLLQERLVFLIHQSGRWWWSAHAEISCCTTWKGWVPPPLRYPLLFTDVVVVVSR